MVAQAPQEHFDGLFDLDEHWPLCWDCGGPEDDLFAPCRVCDCGEPHFASAVAERVESDPYFGKPLALLEDKAGFIPEGFEELAVDVALPRVLRDPEDFGLKLALLLFRVDAFDLTEFHDGFPWREVAEVVDTPLCDACVDATLAREGVGDVFWNAGVSSLLFLTDIHFFSGIHDGIGFFLPPAFFFWRGALVVNGVGFLGLAAGRSTSGGQPGTY